MRRLSRFCVAFAAATFAAQYLLPETWLLPTGLVALALAVVSLALRDDRRTKALLVLGGVCVGLVYNALYMNLVCRPAAEQAGELRPGAVMEVTDWPEKTAYGARVTVRLGDGTKAVYYGDTGLLDCAPGDRLRDDIYLEDAGRIRDREVTTFTSRGIWLLCYGRGTMTVEKGEPSWKYGPLYLRRAVQERIGTLFSERSAPVMASLLLGERSGLDTQTTVDLEESGLYHVTAVSGMHCGILLGLITLVVGKHRRRTLAAVALPLLGVYVLIVGCTPSVLRSFIMACFLLSAPLFGRESDPPTALAAALAVILVQNPCAAASASLQLSFAAVAGLLWLTPKLRPPAKWNRAARFVARSLATTAGALVFTLPISAYYFGFLVLVSPLSNLLCLWAVSLQFLMGLAALVLSVVWFPLGRIAAMGAEGLCAYVLWTAHGLAALPYHALYFTNRYLKYWMVYAYAALGVCVAGKAGKKTWATAGVLWAAALALTVVLGQRQMTAGRLDIRVLDVGQGQCVLLESEGVTALVDCGSTNSFEDAGGAAADALLTMGCRKLDYLVLSHFHTDHAGGVERLLARLEVGTLLAPEPVDEAGEAVVALARERGVRVETVTEAAALPLGEASLTLYPPLGEGENEAGLTALATLGEFDFLATGDMKAATEKALLASVELPDVEVMMAGHHGSRTSTSYELLEGAAPEAVIISVGQNSYGHPTAETLRRLRVMDVDIYRTDLQGSIHIRVQ